MEKIQNYGIIGNGRSAALVSIYGSIDWLCWPRFDSPPLFGAILDLKKGGSWKIAPTSYTKITRQYVEGTNVLQTRFTTHSGVLLITDFMSAFSEEEKQKTLQPEQEIIRRVECEEGAVEIEINFCPAPNYGKTPLVIQDKGVLGLRIEIDRQLITLKSQINLSQKGTGASAKTLLKSREKLDFSLTYTLEGPAVIPPLGDPIAEKLSLTIEFWKNWSKKNKYEGPYKAQVLRSALTLKLLGYAPSGSFVAAPTTSLPDLMGGQLNWDYRYCWLRDAAFTVRALFGLGFKEEGEAFVSWLLHSTRLTLPKLRVLYDVYGLNIKKDKDLPHLQGFNGSRPVRIGNGVKDFFEMDVYGEVIESVLHFVREGGKLDKEMEKMVRKFGDFVCKNWKEPDTGIWEKMPSQHFTHSKLMCWVALDRLIELHQRGELKKLPIDKFLKNRELIRKEIEEKGWNEKMQSYTQTLEGNELDSALLVLPFYDFAEASSEKMQLTLQKIKEKLSPSPGLLYRYEKSPQEKEGAFGLSCFWYAEFLALGGGTLENAHQAFKETLRYANDLGLYSEEIDPKTGDALGNFPQAFTHVGLINAALALEKRGSS